MYESDGNVFWASSFLGSRVGRQDVLTPIGIVSGITVFSLNVKASPDFFGYGYQNVVDINGANPSNFGQLKGFHPSLVKKIIENRPHRSVLHLHKIWGLSSHEHDLIDQYQDRLVALPLNCIVDVNSHKPKVYQNIPGVHPNLAHKIVQHRYYASVESLFKKVPLTWEEAKLLQRFKNRLVAFIDINSVNPSAYLDLPNFGPDLVQKIIMNRLYECVDDLGKIPVLSNKDKYLLKQYKHRFNVVRQVIDINSANPAIYKALGNFPESLAWKIVRNRPYDSVEDLFRKIELSDNERKLLYDCKRRFLVLSPNTVVYVNGANPMVYVDLPGVYLALVERINRYAAADGGGGGLYPPQ